MPDVSLSYKGSSIGSLSDTGTLTMETAGKYCEANIILSYVRPSSGGGVIGPVTQDANGFLVLGNSAYSTWQGGSY